MPRKAPPMTPPSAARNAPSAEDQHGNARGVDADAARHLRIVDGGAHRRAHPGLFHDQPQDDADHERHADHEYPVQRQIEPADHDALGQRLGRIDIEVVAGPDIERRLLEQERKADRQQHLPQRIEAQRPQENPLHQQAHVPRSTRPRPGIASTHEPVVQITDSAT